ncbi:MAG: hypothetical protein SGJ24_02770 [Chloroflexota bacterium]|nr:hypothetical protein [Chloroflexota bacterium]
MPRLRLFTRFSAGLGIVIAAALMTAPIALAQDPLVTNTPQPTRTAAAIPTGTIFVDVPITEAQESDGDGFEIVALTIERTLNAIERVSLTVENTSDTALSGVGWYVLAPAYIEDEPWRFASYIAPVELVTRLPVGETVTLTFDGPDAEAALLGEYSLSGWIHRADADGSTRHADGVGFALPIVVGPPLFLTVDHVDLVPIPGGADDARIVYVTLTLRNYSPQYAEIAYSYALTEPGTEKPWEDGVFSYPYQSLILLPGTELTVTTRDILTLPRDASLQAIGYLQQNLDGDYEFRSSYTFPDRVGAVG